MVASMRMRGVMVPLWWACLWLRSGSLLTPTCQALSQPVVVPKPSTTLRSSSIQILSESSSSSSSSSPYYDSTTRALPSRRDAIAALKIHAVAVAAGTTSSTLLFPGVVAWAEEREEDIYSFRNRDRRSNKSALIREDYWYMVGRTPPRLLTTPLKGDDPRWNAFGSCTTSDSTGTNSCTYVSLKQRGPAYSKYASSIQYGAKEYQQLGSVLQKIPATATAEQDSSSGWADATTYLLREDGALPPAAVDAELKLILFATAMLTSPNFPGPSKELLVARYYANEVNFANNEILTAIQERDLARAQAAWAYGRDAWNSFFQVVNRQIVPKVGDKFESIQ